jgi:hypothetical protein
MKRWLNVPWPLPALGVWLSAWAVFMALLAVGTVESRALLAAVLWGAVCAWLQPVPWRRLLMAMGFPLSWALTQGLAEVPAGLWLGVALLVLMLYPPSTWGNAPLFPTPSEALDGLREVAPLPPMGRILDVGSGAGDGLKALEQAYPDARLFGVESSWPLVWLSRLRCPTAHIRRGNMWAHSWGDYDLVYVFQRPETMEQAMTKARAELSPGAWLVSLEFAVPDEVPTSTWTCPDGRTVWVYQMRLSDDVTDPPASAG